MKKITIILLLILIFTLTACVGATSDFSGVVDFTQPAAAGETAATSQAATIVSTLEVDYGPEDLDTTPLNTEGATLILLNGTGATVEGAGATTDGSNLTISAAGTYQISGTLNDGQIIVDTTDAENVTLILAGVDITSQNSAPIYVANAEKVILTLAAGSENIITDRDTYLALDESGEPNAAIFSKDDLTINGEGTLTVNANYNNGIASKDDLKITGGTITVNAVNDGIKGKDSIAILDGTFTINAGGDGLQSNNAEDLEKGYIVIENGTFNITASLDGMQAETQIMISGGDITINTTGGSSTESAKGIKASVDLTITGGAFNINATDDALHSNNSLTIDGGTFALQSTDDGIHAEYVLTINGGEVNVAQSVEGLESALITINDGNISLMTSDDGINATAGYGGGQEDSSYFYINGGYVLINAEGDGLDSNGNAVISGGTVIVQGPTTSRNGPLDVNGSLDVNGGTLISAGSSGMPETPSTASAQNSIAVAFDATQPGGTIVHIETLDGEESLTYEAPKDFQLFVFSSPELQMNTTYAVYAGGEASGTITNGVYTDGSYTPGTLVANLKIASNLTISGNLAISGMGRGSRP